MEGVGVGEDVRGEEGFGGLEGLGGGGELLLRAHGRGQKPLRMDRRTTKQTLLRRRRRLLILPLRRLQVIINRLIPIQLAHHLLFRRVSVRQVFGWGVVLLL